MVLEGYRSQYERLPYGEFLRLKANDLGRVVIPTTLHESIVKKVNKSLNFAIASRYNDTRVVQALIYGSYARFDPYTGPTHESDIDIILRQTGWLRFADILRFIDILFGYLDSPNTGKIKIAKSKIQIEKHVNDKTFAEILKGAHPEVMTDFILVD